MKCVGRIHLASRRSQVGPSPDEQLRPQFVRSGRILRSSLRLAKLNLPAEYIKLIAEPFRNLLAAEDELSSAVSMSRICGKCFEGISRAIVRAPRPGARIKRPALSVDVEMKLQHE